MDERIRPLIQCISFLPTFNFDFGFHIFTASPLRHAPSFSIVICKKFLSTFSRYTDSAVTFYIDDFKLAASFFWCQCLLPRLQLAYS